MIITARESAALRREVVPLGCTQLDASSRIGVGAYADAQPEQQGDRQQFLLGDTRSLEDVIRELAEDGYITSFCTAGYRCGRTGDKIMGLLRSGKEGQFCKLNAVLTFRNGWMISPGPRRSRSARSSSDGKWPRSKRECRNSMNTSSVPIRRRSPATETCIFRRDLTRIP